MSKSEPATVPVVLFPSGEPADVSALKLCRFCRFYISENGKCDHPSGLKLDYVNGRHTRFYAETQRQATAETDCGHDARFFEARP